jgi:hypothetical protein
MPVSYTIDANQKLVVSRLWGTVTEDEIHEHNTRLRNDPAFDPNYRQLTDLRGLIDTKVSTGVVRETARDQYFAANVKRAFVAETDFAFGMARMFAVHAESSGQTIEVFRDMPEAVRWLGVEPPAAPMRPSRG